MLEQPWLEHYDAGVSAHLDYPEIPLYEFLSQSARQYPYRACTIFEDRQITYAEIDRLSGAVARALVAMGVRKGEPVGILLPNSPQFVLAYYAVLKAGGVVVAINPLYKLRELENQIRETGLRVLFALKDSLDLLDALPAEIRPRVRVLTSLEETAGIPGWLENSESSLSSAGDTAAALRSGDFSLRDLVSFFAGDPAPLPAVRPPDSAIYQYTGGTTGIPKAAIGSHRNLVANTLQFRAWLVSLQDGQEVFLTAIPLYHVYGMVIGMSVGIAMGASLVLVKDARDIPVILSNIQKYKATFFPGVPGLYQAINQNQDVLAGKYNLRSIKACISGSAPLLKSIKDTFESLTGGKLVEGYGLSEAPTATHCNPVEGENRPGSIGLPLPDVDARIVDLERGRQVLPVEEVGELVVKGPQVMDGYYSAPEETAAVLHDGWLHTGDIARRDEDGFFYIIDRKKEVIKIGGFQVWPREVEEVIAQHPAVQEVAVAGVPDTQRGEAVKAWVVLKPGQALTSENVREWCAAGLSGYKVPSLVEFRGPLPRTSVGKLLRRELVRLHNES